MARIRSVKPEFWDDRKLARSTSRDARMLYMGMWNQSDEHGRLNGDEAWLKGRIFPFEEDINEGHVKALLGELEAANRIERYEVDGDPFIFLPKLSKHQRLEPDKVESRIPPPSQRVGAGKSARDADQSEADDSPSALLYVAGSMEHVAGSMVAVREENRAPTDARGSRIPDGWTPGAGLIESMRAEGIPDDLARSELSRFRDHWKAQSGQRGRKADWDATWRNWLRKARDDALRYPPRAGKPAIDPFAAAEERAREAEGNDTT